MPLLDVEAVLSGLTRDEKIALLSGKDFWHTYGIKRLGIPSLRLSDGPNGVRGTRFFNGVPAACLPCGTGLAATWDVDLIREAGELMGREAVAKSAHVVLGPTMNIQRSPLGGRGFESYSEDPYLSGTLGAAIINGIQSAGVAATPKHFTCNDQEHQRQAVDIIVTERALREIYLMPFQLAQRDADPWTYMTSYSKINGLHVSQNSKLMNDILRKEWGFEGLIMSDWHGTYSATPSIQAGLDLEMPGPPRVRGNLVNVALNSGQLKIKDVDDRVRALIGLVNKVSASGIVENAEESSINDEHTAARLRKIGAESQVLLKNEGKVLPLKSDKTTAIIGYNAKIAAYSGGGSASLAPYYTVTPFDGIRSYIGNVKYTLGAAGHKSLPLFTTLTTKDGSKAKMTARFYNQPPTVKDRSVIEEVSITNSDLFLADWRHPSIVQGLFFLDLESKFSVEESADYEFGLTVCGTANLYVDGQLLIDNETEQKSGDSYFGTGTVEERKTMGLEAGREYSVLIQAGSSPTSRLKALGVAPISGGGVRLGLTKAMSAEAAIEEAVRLAKEVEQVIICTGLSADWESEGFDRPHMDLPGHTNAMITAVLEANPNVVVVVQSGTPVAMPWADFAPSILHSWYGGNETGNAIADVLFGTVNPSGKLPLSFPHRIQDNPAFLNCRSDCGRTLYGEDVFVGYRYYEKCERKVRFPFGHGLSYTSFELSDLSVKESSDGETLLLSVSVKNTGPVEGAQVVQAYVAQSNPILTRPPKELKGYAKIRVNPGQAQIAHMSISKKYAASYWNETDDAWAMEADTYKILVGQSSADTPLIAEFTIQRRHTWRGL